jgi:predicted RNase H-like HicB family nuclease
MTDCSSISSFIYKTVFTMVHPVFTLEYWLDDGWYVGRLREVPGIFSQGETLEDLENSICDAYQLMLEENADTDIPAKHSTKMLELLL